MVSEIWAVPEISADRGPVVLALLPRSKRRRRTARRVEIPGIIALRKAAEAVVIRVAAAEAAIAAPHPLAVVVPEAAVVDRMAVAAVEPTAEDTADRPSPFAIYVTNDLPSAR
jgi:hypothetical protein